MAAVLACGDDTVLSHRSAACLWGLLDPTRGQVDVMIATASGRDRRRGIRIHRSRSLAPKDTTRRHGIPVTTSARTIADLKRVASAAELRRAIRQAEVLGLRTGETARAEPTRSELEDRFLALCRRHDLPSPQVNARLGRYLVDFLWPERRLIVETDGYRYHRGALAFEEDRQRDVELRLQGYEVVRLTYRQVTETPDRAIAAVQAALAA